MSLANTAKGNINDLLSTFKKLIEYAKFDKTFRTKIIEQVSVGKYKVAYKNIDYIVSCDTEVMIGDTVWVCAPQNNWNRLYIQSYRSEHGTITQVNGVKGSAETSYKSGYVNISPEDIGLGKVNNTSDIDKPISTAVQNALNNKSPKEGSSSLNKLASQVEFGDGGAFTVLQGNGTYRQKVECLDNATSGDAVFRFSQSEDSGVSYKQLFEIRDDGSAYTKDGKIYTTGNKPGKSDVGLGNVENVSVNDQSPTFTQSSDLSDIVSGEKLSVLLAKISKAISDYILHKVDSAIHVSLTEKANWNDANSKKHTHSNKSILDGITQVLLDQWNAAYTHVSNKSNPHGVTAAQVGALESSQLSNSHNLDDVKTPGFYFAGGGNTVVGKPSGVDAFGVQVYKTASGYITQDLIAGTGNPYKRYTRQWNNSVWSDWIPLPTFTSAPVSGQVVISDGVAGGIKSSGFTIAKSVPSNATFTDTVYTHPNSGVTAGTYKSVTVNAQGHVTGGTNPTTLGGYGITDAAPLNHHHSEYESRGSAIFTVTTSDWSSTAPYSKTILVSGVKSTDEPGLYPYTPKTLTPTQIDQGREMFKCVTDAETSEGTITLYCGKKKPTSEFQILALGISI